MDETVIEVAKEYASKQGMSLSKFVENFLQKVTSYKTINQPIPKQSDTPITDSLIGVLKNIDIGMDDYRKHHAKKHGIKT